MTPEVTRSQEATSPVMVGVVDRARRDMPNGWWAVALFVCSEAIFFGLLIASYFYIRFQAATWPPQGIEKPKVALPLILTAILLSTTLPLFAAVRAGRAGRVVAAWLFVLLALAVQSGYLGIQIHEFLSDLDKVHPKATAYGSIYITMLGAHHLHVAVGILMELWLLSRLVKGITNYRFVALRAIALYWYFVAIVGIAVTFTQISPSL